jgi:hypothetical protein
MRTILRLAALPILLPLTGCPAAAVAPTAAFVACVATTYGEEPAGTPILTTIDDIAKNCAGDAVTIIAALDSQETRAAHASVAHGDRVVVQVSVKP